MPDKEVTPRRRASRTQDAKHVPDRPSVALAILGENLETIREVLYPRFTRKDFAIQILGIGEKQYGRITGAKVYPQLDSIEAIACKLQLQVWQLFVPGFHPKADDVAARAAQDAQADMDKAVQSLERARSLLTTLRHKPPPPAE